MKKYTPIIQNLISDLISDLICDKCQRQVNVNDEPYEFQEFISIEHSCGYGSIFVDGITIGMDLCQYCFKQICKNFAQLQSNGYHIYGQNINSSSQKNTISNNINNDNELIYKDNKLPQDKRLYYKP